MNDSSMHPLPTTRYTLGEKIYAGGRSNVYRGLDLETHAAVHIKMPLDQADANEQLYRNDRDMSALLDSAYVQKCLDLVRLEGKPALVLEYFAGIPLKAQIPKPGFSTDLFLRYALHMAAGLRDIHTAGLIHKNVNSRILLLSADRGAIKFTSFGHATRNVRELIQERGAGFPGALEYIAPEQTGRLNRWVTSRSDLYALGVTFYEMLCGHLPFRYTDPGELLYAHIARPPVFEAACGAPDFLKKVVLKLLAKDPDQRYKSAQGLLNDLESAEQAGPEQHFDPGHAIGANDPSTVLTIPEKLFGREGEIRQLQAAFYRIKENALEMLIVKGYSGIGKTALLFELAPLVAAAKGYMISGKFDQFQRNIPYSALIEGFGKLIKQLLAEGATSIHSWKQRFLETMGPNARLIAEVIPELEIITGPLPEVETLSATAARNRFVAVFRNFVRSFATQDSPFVFFLDDLQWADLATLQLLQDMLAIIEADKAHHILLVGSYRDNELHATHPLLLAIESLRSKGLDIQEIKLENLQFEHINQLVAETLELPPEKTRSLSELVHQKTSGNPFFINQFLNNLCDEGLLRYQNNQGWQWNIEKITAKNYTDNVVEFVAEKIRRLDEEQQRILQVAACIGNVFDPQLVGEVAELPQDQVQQRLASLVNEGLLSVLYQATGLLYHFLHDRIQDAALSSLHPQMLQGLQYRLGMTFANRVKAGDEEKIFDLVNCLNAAIALLSVEEREQLAAWNYLAASKAKRANAYTAASAYLQTALSILPAEKWQTHYRLTCDACSLATECAYLTGDYTQMEDFARETLDHAHEVLEKTFVYEILIQSYGARYKWKDALDTARKALRLLQIRMPDQPSQVQVMTQLMQTMLVVGRRQPEQLEQLPEMSDPSKLAAMRILLSSISSAYLADPNLFPIITFMMVRLSVQHGKSKYAPYTCATYGVIFISALNQIDRGYKFVELGIRQLDRSESRDILSKTLFVWYGFAKHWKHPIHDYLDDFVKAYKYGLESGDIEYALWNMSKHLTYSYLSGVPIARFSEKMGGFLQSTKNMQQVNALVDIWHTQANIVSGQDDGGNNPVAPHYHDRFEQNLLETRYFTALGEHYLSKSMLFFYAGQYLQALTWVRKASRFEENLIGTYYLAILVHYHGLALVKAAIQENNLTPYRREIKKVLGRLKDWAKHSPGSHGQRYAMVLGGYLQAKGDLSGAMTAYQKAIESSRKYYFHNDEAISCHLAADCLKAAGIQDAADTYFRMAHAAYQKWGAVVLANQLAQAEPGITLPATSRPEGYELGQSSETLDLNTILKSSQAISGEIEQERLFAKLIEILVQNAGAEKVNLLLERPGGLTLVASRSPHTAYEVQVNNLPLAQYTDLPQMVVEYVIRTREAVVLHDARSDERFLKDAYIARVLPVSVLCFPLINKGKMTGIIYMENNLTKGVFTAERLKVLQLLSSQIIVSEENARLYQEVRELNRSYERFVPKEFLEFLNKESILQIASGDSVEQDLTVMFSDIRNFTAISEHIAASDTFRFLNEYLKTVAAQIGAHHGIIDKYLGDGILALFPGHADDALQASVDMRRLINRLNQTNAWSTPISLRSGFGIHTGRVMLGTLGLDERLSTTVVGGTVNLAARLEAATKLYGLDTLVSEETVSQLVYPGRFHLRRIDRLQVKGLTIPVTIYEEFSHEEEAVVLAKEATKPILYAGMEAFNAGEFGAAKKAFLECLQRYDRDSVAELHLERCQKALQNKTFVTSPASWSDWLEN